MDEGVRDSTLGCFCCASASMSEIYVLLYVRPVVVAEWSRFLSPDSSESDNISSTTSSSGVGEGRVRAMSCRVDFVVNGAILPRELY